MIGIRMTSQLEDMNMKRVSFPFLISLFILLNLFHHTCLSQNPEIDSLNTLLKALPPVKGEGKGSASDTIRLNILNELSAEYIYTSDYDKAMQCATDAITLATSLLQNKELAVTAKKSMAASYNTLGNVYFRRSDYVKALEYNLSALKIREELGDKKGMTNSYNNIGIIYTNQSDYPKALEYHFKSLQLAETLGEDNAMARSYNNIGNIYILSDLPKALEYYFKSLKLKEKLGDKKGMASSYNNIGQIYYKQSDFPKALEYNFRSLKMAEAVGNKKGMTDSYNNIGEIYTVFYDKDTLHAGIVFSVDNERKQVPYAALLDSAALLQKKALVINRELGDEYGLTFSLSGLGHVLMRQHKYAAAVPLFLNAYTVADTIGALSQKMGAAKSLYEAYKNLKDASSALAWHEKYITHKDSIYNEEVNKKAVQAEMNFEFEKKEAVAKAEQDKKDALYIAELARQTTQRNGFIAGFALMLALAAVTYRSYRNKRKAHAIIAHQKELVEEKNRIVEEKNKDITDSINYAKNIQQAILPLDQRIAAALKEYFVLFKPRDIVSGDFYWFTEKDNYIFIAVADCTGHGVPGAFMSMIGSAILTHVVSERGITEPGKILSEANRKIKEALKQSENNNRDGMEIFLLRFDKSNLNKAQAAGAMRTLYCINDELNEVPGDKMSIGGTTDDHFQYTTHELTFQKGTTLYITSDGYADQFGGAAGKKFRTGNLKKLLLSIQDRSMNDQKQVLNETFDTWKGNIEQVDDVCVIGVKI